MTLAISVISGFIIQLVIYRYFVVGGATLNILLILTVQMSLLLGRNKGMLFGFFSGILEDMLFPGLMGERSIARVIIAYFSGIFKGKLSSENFFFQFILNSLMYIIHFLIIYITRLSLSAQTPGSYRLLQSAFISGLFAPLIYKLIKGIYAR